MQPLSKTIVLYKIKNGLFQNSCAFNNGICEALIKDISLEISIKKDPLNMLPVYLLYT